MTLVDDDMFDRMELSDINIEKMTLIKETYTWYGQQDHSRWIFKSSEGDLKNFYGKAYFKIWNPSYIRRDNILKAIEAGFYDHESTPALKSIIYSKGLCRGYVMDECYPNLTLKLNKNFFNLIKEKSTKTGFFNIQFSPSHVMKFKGTESLIDLEGVFLISDLPEAHKMMSFFDYEEYEKFIVNEYNQIMSCCRYEKFSDKMRNKQYFKNMHPILRFIQSIIYKIYFRQTSFAGKNIHMIEF